MPISIITSLSAQFGNGLVFHRNAVGNKGVACLPFVRLAMSTTESSSTQVRTKLATS
jgi:hypothetical protein